MQIAFSRQKGTIISNEIIANDTFRILFTPPEVVDHKAGQFIGILIKDSQQPACVRAYSLLTNENNDFELCIKKVEGGRATTFLSGLKEGDEIEYNYPLGLFVLDKNHERATSLNFIATGTGIVPLLAMLEELPQGHNQAITLLFGVRTEADICYVERFEALKKKFPQFHYTITLSQPQEIWEGAEGRVTAHIKKPDLAGQYYLCGSGQMIEDVATILTREGVSNTQIFHEKFF